MNDGIFPYYVYFKAAPEDLVNPKTVCFWVILSTFPGMKLP